MYYLNEQIQIIGYTFENDNWYDEVLLKEEITKLNEKLRLKNRYKELTKVCDKMQEIIAQLQEENKQLKDNWNELEEWVKNQIRIYKTHVCDSPVDKVVIYTSIERKMREIKEGKNE